jgi:hypothetical protein
LFICRSELFWRNISTGTVLRHELFTSFQRSDHRGFFEEFKSATLAAVAAVSLFLDASNDGGSGSGPHGPKSGLRSFFIIEN